jgi:hypothetical protein
VNHRRLFEQGRRDALRALQARAAPAEAA